MSLGFHTSLRAFNKRSPRKLREDKHKTLNRWLLSAEIPIRGDPYSIPMMADHGDPCTGSEANFCMNGGTCFKIPSVSTPTCVCSANYEGSRCEQFQLFSYSSSSEEKGLIAAVVIIALLILVVLAVVIYYVYKIKRNTSSRPKPEYWRVKPSGTSAQPV